ncbi:ribonuclease BN [Nitritalea halalkaliphila LW7]|uniref:Ribonuclease BN n=1 Tax=Nitritalea halalkaliphila LW7 TaxID=1189621 RepID=I5C910_9BACT|nr:YihY/virulence factor BrkB family protein [Nitritalea halalkaliphila]EIM78312.1 ribonuclease BN [Nitritalea halalkaliphila LW7]
MKLKTYYRLGVWRLYRYGKKLRHLHFGNPDQNLYDVSKIFIAQLRKDELLEKAEAMAFSFTIAMFPLLLFLLNIIPYIDFFSDELNTENILLFIEGFIPEAIYKEAEGTIEDIVSKPRQSLLSLGFFLALFLSTNGVMSMVNAFNAVYKTRENRSYLKTRFIAVSIIVALVFTIAGASLIMLLGSKALYEISKLDFVSTGVYVFLLGVLRFLVLLIVFTTSVAFIFRVAPAVHDKWKFFSPGSLTAGLLITIAFYFFSYYLNNFAAYNKLYGSIGAWWPSCCGSSLPALSS